MNLKLTITKKKKVVTILRDKPPFVRQITETGMEAMNTNETSNIFDVPWVVMNGLPYQKTAPVHSFNSRSSKKKSISVITRKFHVLSNNRPYNN